MMKPDDSKSPQATKDKRQKTKDKRQKTKDKRQKKKWHIDKAHSKTSVKVLKTNRPNEVSP